MVRQQQVTAPKTVYYQFETSNKSFLEMHYYLKAIGIQRNAFHLILFDADLRGVNPRDPNLNQIMKVKILRECMINYWYFIREVVRVPEQGGAIGDGKPYQLHRGNLAMNFGFIMNWNMFVELPRQFGKSIGACIYYLWVYNFGTTNSEIMFMNKKQEDSKLNLQRVKDIRSALPRYLRMNEIQKADGTYAPKKDAAVSMTNDNTKNTIKAMPGARSKTNATSLGRGCTQPLQWYDEYAFTLHNKTIYMSATPAFSTASANAKKNGKPYGILITTTPGDLTTEEGENAFNTKNLATPFNEAFYDYSIEKLNELLQVNTSSSFFYIRFTYKQLGRGKEYFKEMVTALEKDWPTIRREVLLEWTTASDNSPFTKQDLDTVKALVREPITTLPLLNGMFFIDIYKPMDVVTMRWPPIIGVDVAGGYQQDSSAITIIDSKTTDVIACLNCNYISLPDLAKVIYQLVIQYMPNAIVNIERNGIGHGVLQTLVKTKIKRNLYYEYKEKVLEERFRGNTINKRTGTVKCYGYDNTAKTRGEILMPILRDRMDNYKSKFISPIIYEELCTLEIKKNGRIEHCDKGHDDQIFSYLAALYVWYEGKDLMERFGLQKEALTTDKDDTIEDAIQEDYELVDCDIYEEEDSVLEESKEFFASKVGSKSYTQFLEEQMMDNMKAEEAIRRNPRGRKAWAEYNHLDSTQYNEGLYEIPNEMFNVDYDGFNDNPKPKDNLQAQFDAIQDLR